MQPTRRRYLQYTGGTGTALVSGLAGCLGDGPDETPPSSGGDGNETRPEGTGGPGVSIVATDDSIELPIEPSVELVRDTATAEHPPRLRTTLTNTSDEAVRVGEGRAVHFEYVTSDAGTLILLPGASPDNYPADPDCWRLTDGIATTEEYRTFEIEASESSSRLVDLYATTDADGCLPVGESRFETTIAIVSDGAETEASAAWGFSVLLE